MKAVGYALPSPIEAPEALLDIEVPEPEIGPRDLLVEVQAVSVNPVDVKVRKSAKPLEGAEYKVLGYDAAGTVVQRGRDCSLFKVGDEVWYAGSIVRQGTNSELHAVDERIVALKPKSIGFADAAALPLTAITAWEMLFDRLNIDQFKGAQPHQRKGVLLVVGGAGGVGSILTQIASKLTALTVVATASRPETVQWCYGNGAHFVIDHHRPMQQQMEELNFKQAEYIAALTGTEQHFPELAKIIAPQGKIAIIDDPATLDAYRDAQVNVQAVGEPRIAGAAFTRMDAAYCSHRPHLLLQCRDQGVDIQATRGARGPGRCSACSTTDPATAAL